MKTVIVICVGKPVGHTLVAQLKKFLPETIPVGLYTLMDEFDFLPGEVLAVISSGHVRQHPKVDAKIALGMEYIVARRAIDYTGVPSLLALPAGTEVLLVNDYAQSAGDTIDHLNRIGLDHLAYHPYHPGAADHPPLKIAVTPGEAALVPAGVEQIIDIGSRQADLSTIFELVERLGMMDQLGSAISSQHLREITRLLREIDQAGRSVANLRDTLQILADYAPNGILYTDLAGRVILGNHTLCEVLRTDPQAMANRPISEVVPGLTGAPESPAILTLNGQETMVWETPVKQGEATIGHIYAFETSHAIQALEYELRRKARPSEHEARYTFHDIISKSPQMDRVLSYAQRVARSDSTILIQGESGTGKELFAQAIHNASKRRQGPFVPVNFAAFPMSLLESELFGYEEGAFTGARRGGRRGLFAEAHGGTIFLDEIGDAPLEFQVRLLRVLQERQVRPVGGSKLIPIDVRVIAATHTDLARKVREGNFREDLYYRLSVLPLRMPRLRDRREDIPLLIDQFIRRFSQGRLAKASAVMSPATLELLCGYPWPGNIRQLSNVVEFLMNIRDENRLVEPAHLPEYLLESGPAPEDGLLRDLLGQDLAWVLGKFWASESVGRRRLAELAARERPHLTEGVIRGLLATAESLGLVVPAPGRRGSTITGKGRLVAEKWLG
jgi:transcriptional regulator with PAS, ATPase and Fis domain